MLRTFIFKPLFVFSAPLFSVLLLAVPSVQAQSAPGKTISDTVKALQDAVTSNDGKSDAEIDAILRKILAPVFDFAEMARSSLGSNWSSGSADQQKEFVDLFSELLARTYLKRIKDNVKDADYHLLKEQPNGEHALVKTTVIDKGDKITIDYRMLLKDGSWQVYDVVIENVGLVTNFRTEYGAIVRKEGFDGLLKRLRDKVAATKPV